LELAVLASAGGQSFLRAVHVSLQDPVANFVTLIGREQVLFGERDLIRRRNISFFEVSVVGDTVVFRVFNGVIEVDVAVEEDVCEVVGIDLLASISSI